jgi:uncharacterized membrane protein
MLGIGWFLSVLYLMITVMIVEKIEDQEIATAIQGTLVTLWITIGVTCIIVGT